MLVVLPIASSPCREEDGGKYFWRASLDRFFFFFLLSRCWCWLLLCFARVCGAGALGLLDIFVWILQVYGGVCGEERSGRAVGETYASRCNRCRFGETNVLYLIMEFPQKSKR